MLNCTTRTHVRNTEKYFWQSGCKWENNMRKRQTVERNFKICIRERDCWSSSRVSPSIANVLDGESNFSLLLVPISRWLPCLWSSFLFASRLQFLFWRIISFHPTLHMTPTSVVSTGSGSTPSAVSVRLSRDSFVCTSWRLPSRALKRILVASGFCPALYCPLNEYQESSWG
jgi:hypothetical protein